MKPSEQTTILIVEDEPALRRGLADFFSDCGYRVITAADGSQGLALFRQELPDLVFSDLKMPVMDGMELLSKLVQLSPATPVVIISGAGGIRDAVEAVRTGAWDYVVKPVHDLASLELLAKRALENSSLRREVADLKQKLLDSSITHPAEFRAITTRTPSILGIFRYIEVIARTAQPVLIMGETGVGKELFATAVHLVSGRSGKLVSVNLAGLDDHMFCDTLFGHCKGAFTGAEQIRKGLLEQAADGTLLLDEIGDLNESSQIKLLRLLQEGEYYPLGSDVPVKSSARIVLATHRNLEQMVHQGAFRLDLYYRLSAHRITIPPLRERQEDLPLLLDQFLSEAADLLQRPKPTVPAELVHYLATYQFPGNIRELRAMVFDAVARHNGGILSIRYFNNLPITASDQLTGPVANNGVYIQDGLTARMPTLREAEQILIQQAMEQAGGNQSLAARILGIQRTTLCKKLSNKPRSDCPKRTTVHSCT